MIKEDRSMKAFGVLMIGAMAVAGGIAAATYLTKKKLDKENEDNYYDDWDNDNIDDDWDFDFDEDMDVEGEPAAPAEETPVAPAAPEPTGMPEVKPTFGGDVFGVSGSSSNEDI